MPKRLPLLLMLLIAWLLAACQPQSAADDPPPATPTPATPTPTELPLVIQTPTPTPAPTPELLLWVPAPLGSRSVSGGASALFYEQIDAFNAENPDLIIKTRIKATEGAGSLYEFLRTSRQVAPDVLPDLVLLRESELQIASANGWLAPLDDLIDDSLAGELYDAARIMGIVGENTFGIPYLLDFAHLIYHQDTVEQPPLDFEDLFALDVPYAFPAGALDVGQHANAALLTQYLAAGGKLLDEEGAPILDSQPLLITLGFYEDALKNGIISPEALNHAGWADYAQAFYEGAAPIAQIGASAYLRAELQDEEAYAVAPILTSAGGTEPILSGWYWAIVSQDAIRRDWAGRLISWMIRRDNLAVYAESLGMLPAQRGALSRWEDATFFETQLEDAQPAPSIDARPAIVALQNAFVQVMKGEATAVDASQAAIDALSAP